jgi:hypothetical protein
MSMQIKSYTDAEARAIGVLHRANQGISDFFAETDGRQYIIAYAHVAG